jgi:hypothetical protein
MVCTATSFGARERLPYKRLRCSRPYHSQSFPVSLLLSISFLTSPLSKQGPTSNKPAAPRCALSSCECCSVRVVQHCAFVRVLVLTSTLTMVRAAWFSQHCLQSCLRAPVVLCAGARSVTDQQRSRSPAACFSQVLAVVFACACRVCDSNVRQAHVQHVQSNVCSRVLRAPVCWRPPLWTVCL